MLPGVRVADQLPEDEQEQPTRFDLWVEKKFGSEKAQKLFIGSAVVLGIVLSIALFILLPTFLVGLIPDIKGEATVVFDAGRFYPHHNLYYITTSEWEPRALQSVLRSSVAVAMVATYCTRMAGGFLRFQAQYLRRIRLPRWAEVPEALRAELAAVALERRRDAVDEPVFRLYGLEGREAEYVSATALDAQVKAKTGST